MPQYHEIRATDGTPWEAWLSCSETQLLHFYEPAPGLFIAESPNVISRALAAGYEPVSFLIDRSQLSPALRTLIGACGDIPVYAAETAEMERLAGYHLTRGVLCAMRRKPQSEGDFPQDGAYRIAVLENIMNPTNLGAVFRSAAALGVDAVLLTAGCTDPLYRRAARVSMGTVFQVPWLVCADCPTAAPVVEKLKSRGFLSAAMALSDRSVPVDDPRIGSAERLCIVLGTEGEGLCPETIAACDYTVRIPMSHGVDSLNVAAASAVAFWELRRRG